MSDLLPPNATPQERALAETIARISNVDVSGIRAMWNPDTCPIAALPWLAWAFSVDEWDASWSEAQKRSAIKSAVEVQRHKGTIGAVRSALSALGYGVQVQEWFNQTPANVPYTYRLLLTADQIGIDQKALAKILQVIASAKNLRSHMSEAVQQAVTRATLTLAGAVTAGNEITIAFGGSSLPLDGSWSLDGQQRLGGLRS